MSFDDEPTVVWRQPPPSDLAGAWGAGPPAPLFRPQAVEAHRRGAALGSPLRVVPAWMVWSTRLVVLVVLAAVGFAAVARVADHARGSAVIRVEGRLVLDSHTAGSVTEVAVQPGDRVEAGAVLVRFDDTMQRAELDRVEREYELSLARLLRDQRAGAHAELATLAGELALARTRLAERTVTATEAGLVSDVRVRAGHRVEPGDALVAIDRDSSRVVVVGMLPGHFRPRLAAADTRARLVLDGFSREPVDVTVRSVADEVVGPAEALRYLGREQAGALELGGPVVIVEATVDGDRTAFGDESFRFYDGMQGVLELRLDESSLLRSLVSDLGGGA
jgi:membrane fusion protein (multidrug efflux system)